MKKWVCVMLILVTFLTVLPTPVLAKAPYTNDEINQMVEDVQKATPEEEKQFELMTRSTMPMKATYFDGDKSHYNGKKVVELTAFTKLNLLAQGDDKEQMKNVIRLFTYKAKLALKEYPDAQMIRVSVAEAENSPVADGSANFYVVDGKLVISLQTTSYNPKKQPKQMTEQSVKDQDNPLIPAALVFE